MAPASRSKHPGPAPSSSLPCLVFDYGADADQRRPTTLYNVADGVHRRCDWATSHGWVLTYDLTTLATFLWNPQPPVAAAAVRRKIILPSFRQTPPPVDSFCAISTKPNDGERIRLFTVVVVEPPDSHVIRYCHVGSSPPSATWVRYEYDIGTEKKIGTDGLPCKKEREKRSIHSFTSCGDDGKFYFFINPHLYGVLEFSPDQQPVVGKLQMRKPIGIFTTAKDFVVASIFSIDINGELHL
uniref:DUF1618 domain-containing protein n=1 Tax=Leersia perrieri TaxID=77586 RepID=A0A0D9WLI5_9ORYZ